MVKKDPAVIASAKMLIHAERNLSEALDEYSKSSQLGNSWHHLPHVVKATKRANSTAPEDRNAHEAEVSALKSSRNTDAFLAAGLASVAGLAFFFAPGGFILMGILSVWRLGRWNSKRQELKRENNKLHQLREGAKELDFPPTEQESGLLVEKLHAAEKARDSRLDAFCDEVVRALKSSKTSEAIRTMVTDHLLPDFDISSSVELRAVPPTVLLKLATGLESLSGQHLVGTSQSQSCVR